jgi:hypothetical protein
MPPLVRQGAETGRQARLRTVCPLGVGVRLSPLALILLAIGYWLLATPALAQEFTYSRALSDYVYTFDQYRFSHSQYELKVTEYRQFGTLTAQTAAYQAGLEMLLRRDDVVRTHLTALRLKLAETTGVNPLDRQAIFARIDQEVNWLFYHQTRLKNTTNLSELTRISKELESHYPTINVLMYQALATILGSKQNFLHQELNLAYLTLKDKISHMRQAQEDTTTLDRWLEEAGQKLELSAERLTSARVTASRLTAQIRNLAQEFTAITATLKESHQYLKETAAALQEIITSIL